MEGDYILNPQDAELGRTIYFDMDGTIADLYGVTDCFKRLDNNDASVYLEAKPIPEYVQLMYKARDMGYRVGIITAGSRFPPDTPQPIKDQMNKDTEEAKRKWLEQQGLASLVSVFHFVPYGVSKYDVADDRTGILVDDSDAMLNEWFSDKIKAIPRNKAIHDNKVVSK